MMVTTHHIGTIYDLTVDKFQIMLVHDELGYNDDTEFRPAFEVTFMDEWGQSFVWEDCDTYDEAIRLIEKEARRIGIWQRLKLLMKEADRKRDEK